MSDELSNVLSRAGKSATIWGIVVLILGVLAIASPFVTGIALTMVLGVLILLTGIAQLLYAFQAGSLGGGLLRALFGGIAIVFGIAVMTAPAAGLVTLTLVLATYFLVDGIFSLVAGFQLKPTMGWGWMVFNGVITILLAWIIFTEWPISGAWVVGTLVGVRLVMNGISMIVLGSAGKAIGRELGGAR